MKHFKKYAFVAVMLVMHMSFAQETSQVAQPQVTIKEKLTYILSQVKSLGQSAVTTAKDHATKARKEITDAVARKTYAGKAKALISSQYVYKPILAITALVLFSKYTQSIKNKAYMRGWYDHVVWNDNQLL